MFQEQWKLILDDEFMEAYLHGIVIKCLDGVTRRFYPRIFIYIADYPEKFVPFFFYLFLRSYKTSNRTLVATIKNGGNCPCPRCLTPKSKMHMMGTKDDMSKRNKLRTDNSDRRDRVRESLDIIHNGYAVNTADVENLLHEQSWVATSVSWFNSSI
jgi:hypothetical protein